MLDTPNLKVIDRAPRIGSEIQTDVETLLSGAHASEIRDVLEQRGVICFRGVFLTDAQQVMLAKTLGEVIQKGAEDGISKITLDKKLNAGNLSAVEYQRGAFFWHIDGATDDVPTRASLLTARKLAPTGGQTEFANTYAAYDDLPEAEKQFLDTVKVVHTLEASQRLVTPWPTYAKLKEWHRYPPKAHPLVWKHQSGRKSLVLGATASHVEGMSLEDGRELLCRLCEWATQPQYVYSHSWQMGDTVIWDNTGTMHRVTPYDIDCGRLMHRTTLVGEEVLA